MQGQAGASGRPLCPGSQLLPSRRLGSRLPLPVDMSASSVALCPPVRWPPGGRGAQHGTVPGPELRALRSALTLPGTAASFPPQKRGDTDAVRSGLCERRGCHNGANGQNGALVTMVATWTERHAKVRKAVP